MFDVSWSRMTDLILIITNTIIINTRVTRVKQGSSSRFLIQRFSRGFHNTTSGHFPPLYCLIVIITRPIGLDNVETSVGYKVSK